MPRIERRTPKQLGDFNQRVARRRGRLQRIIGIPESGFVERIIAHEDALKDINRQLDSLERAIKQEEVRAQGRLGRGKAITTLKTLNRQRDALLKQGRTVQSKLAGIENEIARRTAIVKRKVAEREGRVVPLKEARVAKKGGKLVARGGRAGRTTVSPKRGRTKTRIIRKRSRSSRRR